MNKPTAEHYHFKPKIAVSGAAETAHCGERALDAAHALGTAIAKQGAIAVTGATTGFPLWVARGVKEAGGTVIGISPAASEGEHVELYKLPLEYCDLIIYTGSGYSGRNLLLTRAADAVAVGCGRIGTINEFTIAYEDKKPLGVLEGGWPTDEVIHSIIDNAHRPNKYVIFDRDPASLVERLLAMVQQEKRESYIVRTTDGEMYTKCTDERCKLIL